VYERAMKKNFWRLLFALIFAACAAFAHAEAARLPANLQWQTNDSDPIFADPNAKRGGRFRTFMTSFPPTLRLVGPDSNSSFAGYLRANNLALVNLHPNTLNPIPELATTGPSTPTAKRCISSWIPPRAGQTASPLPPTIICSRWSLCARRISSRPGTTTTTRKSSRM